MCKIGSATTKKPKEWLNKNYINEQIFTYLDEIYFRRQMSNLSKYTKDKEVQGWWCNKIKHSVFFNFLKMEQGGC